MKVGGIHKKGTLNNVLSNHFRFQIDGEQLHVASFFRFINPLAQNIDPSILYTNEEAAILLADLPSIEKTAFKGFTNEQLGLADVGYWKMRDVVTYDNNNPDFSSAEKDGYASWVILSEFDGKLIPPYNKFIDSYQLKTTLKRDCDIAGATLVAHVFKPFPTATLSQCKIIMHYKTNEGFHCNVEATEHSGISVGDEYKPKIVVSAANTIAADASMTITVNVVDPETDQPLSDMARSVYIETTAGYINKQRLSVNQNGATMKLRATDLEVGDLIKVKFGWRHISGMVEKIITVV